MKHSTLVDKLWSLYPEATMKLFTEMCSIATKRKVRAITFRMSEIEVETHETDEAADAAIGEAIERFRKSTKASPTPMTDDLMPEYCTQTTRDAHPALTWEDRGSHTAWINTEGIGYEPPEALRGAETPTAVARYLIWRTSP